MLEVFVECVAGFCLFVWPFAGFLLSWAAVPTRPPSPPTPAKLPKPSATPTGLALTSTLMPRIAANVEPSVVTFRPAKKESVSLPANPTNDPVKASVETF